MKFRAVVLLLFSCAAAEARAETGFLHREIRIGAATERYVVYVPRTWQRETARLWPVLLYLHSYGESGDDGQAPAANALATAISLHPERFPFLVVFPQNPWGHTWLEKERADAVVAILEAATRDFAGDADRTSLAGFSMGGFGAWSLAARFPGRFAAVVALSGGLRAAWTPPEAQAPDAYDRMARALGRTPVWISHGDADGTVSVDEARALYEALERAGGRVRYSEYQEVGHTPMPTLMRADFPEWLLAQRRGQASAGGAERERVPLLPPPVAVDPAALPAYVGRYEYSLGPGTTPYWLQVARDGDQIVVQGADWSSAAVLRPVGSDRFRCEWEEFLEIAFERGPDGAVTGLRFRDDRHEERYARVR